MSREGERAGGLLYGGLGGARVMGGENANGVIGDGFVWSARRRSPRSLGFTLPAQGTF